MASSKQKKGLKSTIGNVLGHLLGDDDYPVKAKSSTHEAGRLGTTLPSHSGKRELFDDDNFFSKLAEEAGNDEDSDVSEADPTALLESMKDIDDMDADLFGSKKKPSSAPAQSKGSGMGGPKKDPPKPGNKLKREGIDEPAIEDKKPSSAPASTVRGYKKFSFTDFDDPFADLLDDLPTETKQEPRSTKAPPEKSLLSPSESPIIKKKETASPAQAPKKRDELTFDDDEDDLMDALGFGESPKESPKKKETVLTPKNESSEPSQRARTRLDEILGRGTSPRLLERPLTGERKDQPQQQEKPQQEKQQQKTPSTKDPFLDEDITFGSYQPTLVSTPEGRVSRRQSVRFSTEDISASSPEKKPKPITPVTPTTPTSTRSRPGADWLGLTLDDDDQEEEEEEEVKKPQSVPETLKTPSSPSVGGKPPLSGNRVPPAAQPAVETPSSFSSKPPRPDVSVSQKKDEEEDWLSGALSRKKTQAATWSEEKKTAQEDSLGLGEEVDLDSFLSKRGSSPASRRKPEDTSTPSKEPGDSPVGPRATSRRLPSPTLHSTPVRDDQSRPAKSLPSNFEDPEPSSLPPTIPTDHPEQTQATNHTLTMAADDPPEQISADIHSQSRLAQYTDGESEPIRQHSHLDHTLHSLTPQILPDSASHQQHAVFRNSHIHYPLPTDTSPPAPSSPPQTPSIVIQQTPTTAQPLPSSHPVSPLPSTAVAGRVGFPPGQVPPPQPPRLGPAYPAASGPSPLPTSAASLPHPQQYQNLQDFRAPGWAELPPNYPAQQWHPMSTIPPDSTWLPQQSQMQNIAPVVQPQVSLTADSLQQLLLQQQLVQSQLLGLGGAVDVGAVLQRQKKEKEQQSGELALHARVIQLEGQVRSLQLERDQNQMLLESVQQRHKQDTELMENTHRARVKLLEESAAQREMRARQECEDLAERLATVTRLAEQERSELQAQHQRRLAQSQQDRDREVERLRDLQRKSILEMKKDHEDQVQRLKRLKDEEVDAVTSATSQTRSLTVVIEQMEQFSHRLGDLSSRVESTHENTAQGLEHGARHREEQLRVMQDRLGQQQRAMAEERTRLKEVIAKMDTQLAEQQRQLEKERWRVTAEQAKAESSHRGLDEERRSMTQHINMEREELERAKSALLEEQQSVMQRCAEERRKLAAEWTQFRAQEKLRQDREEREASRALERDANREGSIISMAQNQADLKLRAGELKQKEEAVAREREALERQKEELDREKERIGGTALRLKTRAQEVEAFSKLASEKYEEGERSLQEARQVETDHQTRLRSIHSQMERLRQQEQNLHQERIKMTDQRREVDRLRQSLPITPLPPTIPPIFTDFSPVLAGHQMASTLTAPQSPSPGSTELQARLALLRHTAEKDRDYLQDEQFFLDTLKKAPYNSAFHTD